MQNPVELLENAQFKFGTIVMTRGISYTIEENPEFSDEIYEALEKYSQCDWGVTCDEDKEQNDYAVENDERIIASYDTSEGRIWIITEWDRSATTILYPDEY